MMNLNQLHKDHLHWLGQIDFYQDEIKFFQKTLFTAILAEDHSPITEEHIAEYRELFFLNLKRLDDLRHLILRHEVMIKREGRESFDNLHDHGHVAEQMSHVEKVFMELRIRFRAFASHHI
ncbi:MAG: hypothetical protein RLZZ165_573 [Bacteroidota bacterium]|jgi:hypothetical protein